METLYDVLGIDATADSETIRRAYREQAKRHHPDVSKSSAEKYSMTLNENATTRSATGATLAVTSATSGP